MPPFLEVAAHGPEPPEEAREAQADFRVRLFQRPGQGRPQVIVFAFGPRQPLRLRFARAQGCRVFGPVREPLPVLIRQRCGLGGDLGTLFTGILAHGFEQPVAGGSVRFRRQHQRLVHELREEIQNVIFVYLVFISTVAGADRLGGLQGPASGEDRQAAQQGLLRRSQQVEAPIDHRPQGLPVRQVCPAVFVGQQPEAIIKPRRNLFHRQDFDPGRRQLDCQRNAVEAAADIQQGGGISRSYGKRRRHGKCPVQKQAGCFAAHQGGGELRAAGSEAAHIRQTQRRNCLDIFPGNSERGTAGRQNSQGGAGAEQCIRQGGTAFDQMLTGVQNEQERARLEILGQRLGDGPPRLFANPQHRRHCRCDQGRVGERGHLHKPDPVRIVFQQVGGGLERQPRLAAAPGAGEGQQPHGSQPRFDLRELRFAAHKRRQLLRQIVRQGVERLQRREIGVEGGMEELKDLLGPQEVFQVMQAHVPQPRPRRQSLTHESFGRLGQQSLPARADHQPCDPVDIRTEIIPRPLLRRARVQGRPDPQRQAGSQCGYQLALNIQCRPDGFGGGGECHAKRIPDRLKHVPAMPLHDLPQEGVMSG